MCYLNDWHTFGWIRFDPVKITIQRCLFLQIWEQQKQLLQKQRVIQLLYTPVLLNIPGDSDNVWISGRTDNRVMA